MLAKETPPLNLRRRTWGGGGLVSNANARSSPSQRSFWSVLHTLHLLLWSSQCTVGGLSFTYDIAEAPLTVYAVYAPQYHREQVRDELWEHLTNTIHSHTGSQPVMASGDFNYFNAQPLDELACVAGAVGPHFQKKETLEESSQAETDGDSNHIRFLKLILQEDLCLPQTWMQKTKQQRIIYPH